MYINSVCKVLGTSQLCQHPQPRQLFTTIRKIWGSANQCDRSVLPSGDSHELQGAPCGWVAHIKRMIQWRKPPQHILSILVFDSSSNRYKTVSRNYRTVMTYSRMHYIKIIPHSMNVEGRCQCTGKLILCAL